MNCEVVKCGCEKLVSKYRINEPCGFQVGLLAYIFKMAATNV